MKALGSFTESSTILGASLGYDAVLRMIPHLDLRNSIVFLAKILWALDELKLEVIRLQTEISQFLLEDYLVKIRSVLADETSVIYFQPQIMALMKLIILKSVRRDEQLGNVPAEQMRKVGLSLLGISDEISRQAKRLARQFRGENLADVIAKELILSGFHVRNLRSGSSLVRATHLYINIANQLRMEGEVDFLDLDEVLKEAIGVGLKEYLSFGVALLVYFLRFSEGQKFPEDPAFMYLRPDAWFRDASVSKEILIKILLEVSDDAEGFSERLAREGKRELFHDFIEFKTRPLLKLQENLYLPLSLPFLYEKVTSGLYWIIFDYLKRNNKQDHDKFMRLHGKLFQRYVEEIVTVILNRTPASDFIKHVDVVYREGKKEHRSSDIILRKGTSLFLFEASATRLQAKNTTGLGNETALAADIGKMVLHNAKSIQTCIVNIKEGNLKLNGINLTEIKRFYPIIVTIEGLPKHPAIQLFLNNLVRSEGLLTAGDIGPLALIDAEDLEEVEGYTEGDFIETILAWIDGESFTQFGLADYIKRKYPKIAMRSKWLDGLTNQIFNEATMLFFGKPMPARPK